MADIYAFRISEKVNYGRVIRSLISVIITSKKIQIVVSRYDEDRCYP